MKASRLERIAAIAMATVLIGLLWLAPIVNPNLAAAGIALLFLLHAMNGDKRVILLAILAAIPVTLVKLGTHTSLIMPRLDLAVGFLASMAVTSLMAILWKTLAAEDSVQSYRTRVLTIVVLFTLSALMVRPVLLMISRFTPTTFDLFTYAFDATLGSQLSFQAAALMHRFPALAISTTICYWSLVIPIGAILAAELRQRRRLTMVYSVLFAEVIGVATYSLFPVCGPRYVFQSSFPDRFLSSEMAQRLILERIPIEPSFARNGVPSLHLTWALLVLYNSRSRLGRISTALFALATLYATLATGEHYVSDLIFALPLSVGAQAIATGVTGISRRIAITNLSVYAAWLVALRFGVPLFRTNYAIPWLAILATVSVSFVGLSRLTRETKLRSQTVGSTFSVSASAQQP